MLERYGSRVRLLPSRNLAVVLGGCNDDAIERVASVTAAKQHLMIEAGIVNWAMHVDSLRARVVKQVASK